MSDNIPFELQEQIIKLLPVKSLIRCRSVSKAWKSLIDSSDFIVDHIIRRTQPEYLLVRYKKPNKHKNSYISIVDDDPFPDRKFIPSVPPVVERLVHLRVLGSSHGLLCLCGRSRTGSVFKCVIWNPSIRKSITVSVPDMLCWKNWSNDTVLGFGVCPPNLEPTMVKIASRTNKRRIVEVYRVSTGRWRSVSSKLPPNSIEFTWSHVAIDGFIYWLAYATVSIPGESQDVWSHNIILSFDMADDSLGEIILPSPLMDDEISVFKLRESLAVLQQYTDDMIEVFDVWVMDDGVQKSFSKLFTINAPIWMMIPLGFRTNGEPIFKTKGHHGPTALCVYEPTSECINDLGIYAASYNSVTSYAETLLLLNR